MKLVFLLHYADIFTILFSYAATYSSGIVRMKCARVK